MKKGIKILALVAFLSFVGWKAWRRFTTPELPLWTTRLVDAKGQELKLSEAKEKYLLVSYFQSWCGDCIRELPSMVNLQKEVGGDKIKLVFISDEDWTKIGNFQTHAKISIPCYQSDKSMDAQGIYVYPSTFLLGPDRKVLLLKRERFDWNSAEVKAFIQ